MYIRDAYGELGPHNAGYSIRTMRFACDEHDKCILIAFIMNRQRPAHPRPKYPNYGITPSQNTQKNVQICQSRLGVMQVIYFKEHLVRIQTTRKMRYKAYFDRASANFSMLSLSRLAVGSSRAKTPQLRQKVSARASLIIRQARTYRRGSNNSHQMKH
jgi:hypothetical protein